MVGPSASFWLMAVALVWFEAELAHSGEAVVAEIVRHLDRAAVMHREPQDGWAVRHSDGLRCRTAELPGGAGEVRAAPARTRARWTDYDAEPNLG
ncbi:hypothetical protein [Acidocella sp.]|uniref:hypothetical protein n=1 Tax=Acidocella sp. TaxID=50710 RepID=UPI003D01D1B1